MRLINLTCNSCGAPLEVREEVRFLTCRFCSSQLAVEHEGNAVYTKVLAAIDQRTAGMARDIETIKLQNELEQLDRDAARALERRPTLVHDEHGDPTLSGCASTGCGVIGGGVLTLLWLTVMSAIDAPFLLQLFGLLFVTLAAGTFLGVYSQSRSYREHEAQFESRRRRLREELDSRRAAG